MSKRSGRKSLAQTPAPKSERIKGSKVNPKGSASSDKTASKIVVSAKVLSALMNKLKEFKQKHPNKKNITLADLKAVYRRGAGAYSSSHRPTITGGKPNTRNAWAMARVNKFLLKAGGTKVKKAYVQDDDLMKYNGGGNVKTDFNEFENDGLRKALLSFWGDFTNGSISEYLGIGKENYVLTDYDNMLVISRNTEDFSDAEKNKIQNWIEPYLNEDKKPNIAKYLIGYEIKNNRIMIKINPNESYAEGGLIAPNGKKSNLTPEQYKLVRTPEFKAWFGDWENDPANASKVIDENGEPKVLFHGTKYEFYEFKSDQYIYTSENSDYQKKLYTQKSQRIIELFAKSKNVLDLTHFGQMEFNLEKINNFFKEKKIDYTAYKTTSIYGYFSYQGLTIHKLKEAGYDAVKLVFEEEYEGKIGYSKLISYTGYIFTNSNQIKLADGTNTTFDGRNPDIRYEGGGEIDKLIQDNIVEIKMYDTKPEHAKMYGFDSERPLFIKSIIVSQEHRGKGIGSKVMQHIVDYATTNGHDIIFGHITQEAEPSIDVIKSMLRKSGFNTIEGNNDFYKIINEYADGGKTEDHAETYKKWRSLVNMSLSELKRFYESDEGKKAGLSASEAKSQGIDSGRESARMIMKMKQTPKSEWTPAMWKWAKKQISFISRMSGNKGGLYDDKGNKTRKHTSLLIWGHNPKKSSSMKYEDGGEIFSVTDPKYKFVSLKYKENDTEIGHLNYYYSKDEVLSNGMDKKPYNFDSELFIEIVEVEKEHRNKGIAKKLFNRAIQDAKNLGVDVITLRRESGLGCDYGNPYDTYLKSLYSKIGFIETWTLEDEQKSDGEKSPCAMHLALKKYENGGEMDVRMEDTVQRMDNPNFADPSYYENGGMSGSPADFSKVITSSSRFRPKETIYFDPPLIGMNGNQLVSYTWSYEWTEDWSKTKGEPISKRVSDWTQAEISADTGRNIVHKYTILKKDGTSVTVSSDSVPVLLGYVEKTQTVQFSNLATASKTLAKQKLQLSILEAKYKQFQDAKNEIISRGYPEVVNMGEGALGIKYMMGDAGVWDGSAKSEDPIDKERLESLKDSYVNSELKKIGIDPYSYHVSNQIYDLKNRIARQERKIQNILNSKMEDGGVLYGISESEVQDKLLEISKKHKMPVDALKTQLEVGISMEMEHTGDNSVASKIALDHLEESPLYYQKLKIMEQELKQMPDQDYLNRVLTAYENGGMVDMVYSFTTPTGQPTKLNYIQQILVRTPEFKAWFGDWEACAKMYMKTQDFKESYKGCSIVVDQFTLEPQVVFHGTNFKEEFYTFDVTKEQGVGRPYGYFADNREYSENFTKSSQRGEHGLQILYNCFLNIKKPFFAISAEYYGKKDNYMYWSLLIGRTIFEDNYDKIKTHEDAKKFTEFFEVVMSQVGNYLFDALGSDFKEEKPFWTLMAKDANKEFKLFLMSHGYDGIRYAEEFMSVYDIDDPSQFTKAWTIFDANQVKLADGRNIDFDPMKKDIRYDEGGETQETQHIEEPINKYKKMRENMGLEKTFAEGGHVEGDGKKTNDAKKGGFFKGRSHAEGGIKGVNVDTGQLLEVEGNEVIINKKSVQDPKKRLFEGKMMTNREILSKINEEGGGVAFEDGGEITEKSCRCTGKKYKFGGNLVSDFDIVKQLTTATDFITEPINSAVNYVDGLIRRMYNN